MSPLKMIWRGLLLVSVMLTAHPFFAQTPSTSCGTDLVHRRLLDIDPAYRQATERNESEYWRYLHQWPDADPARGTGCAGDQRRVPVVVHVIHLNEPVGTGSNISDAQIMGAIDGLNNRWRAIIGDGADMGFEFCLAKRTPAGAPTNGIVRVNGSGVPGYTAGGVSHDGGPGADETEIKALSTWPQNQYYNIWVVHDISGSVAGYAYFPNGGPLDGTVIVAGTMTQGSSTLTHELGHGFNLFHTFEGDNDGADCPPDNDCTQDGDRVCDTPPHKVDDCGATNPCGGGGNWDDSRRNYMSYCGGTTRFTTGQGVRVNAASYGAARAPLFASEGCIPADENREAGILRIVYPFQQPLCDDTFEPIIRIKNYGTQPISSITIETWVDGALWQSTMRAPNLATGNEANLTLDPVTLTPGGHDIDYRIADINGGGGDPYPDNNRLCTYLYYEPVQTAFPACWDFESGQKPESWVVNGPLITVAEYGPTGCMDQGDHCLVFEAFHAGAGGNGTQTLMAMVPLDLSGMTGAALNFDVAMRRNFYADHLGTLEVLVSTDCGQTLTPVYLRRDINGGNTENLHTVPHPGALPTSSWFPTDCSHWRRDIADLSAFAGQEVLVAFRFTIDKGFSENLYLDNICVQSCDGFAEITAENGPGVCFPDSAHFTLNTGPGFVYKWFMNKKPIPGAQDPDLYVKDPGLYFGVVEADGCRYSTDTLEMLYFPQANPQIIGNVSVCEGDTAIMDAGEPYDIYLWSTGDTTRFLQVTETGTYTVTVTNAWGCTGQDWTQVTHKIKPNANINGNPDFCEGGSTTLSVSIFANDVLWSTGDTTTSIQVTATGTYSVTVTNSNGCSDTQEILVTERIPQPPQISGVLAICSGTATQLDAGSGYASYKWSNGPITRTNIVTAAGNYSVTVTDQWGCVSSASVDVAEHPKPTPTITGSTSFCEGTAHPLDAGGGYAEYLWSNGETTPQILVTASGIYQVTVTSAAGCTGATQITVTELPSPQPQITGDTDLCEGETSTLNAGNNFFSYEWSTGASGQTLVVQATGTYIVTVTNSIGCPGTDTIDVTVHPTPAPVITGVPAICAGEQTVLDAGSGFASYLWTGGQSSQTLTVTAGGIYTVTVTLAAGCSGSASVTVTESPNPQPQIAGLTAWCEGETNVLDAGAGYATYLWTDGQSSPTLSVAQSGSYSVTVTNNAGCSGTDTHTVTVHPLPQVEVTGILEFCEGASTTLTAGGPAGSYLWSSGESSAQIAVTLPGNYSVTLTDANGCRNSASATVTQQSLVSPSVVSIPATVCPGALVQLVASGGTDYLWLEGAAMLNDPTIANPSLVVNETVTLSVEVSNSCNAEVVSITLDVKTPLGMAGPDLNVLQGREVTLSATGGVQYLWDGPYELSCTQCPEPRTTPAASGTFYVTITDIQGCETTDSVFVEVYDDLDLVLDLVNTITPNGDGFNDLLIIKGLESFDANSLTIYNRWGEQIFHQDNYQNTFDGTIKGKRLPPGTYYYVLRLWPGDRIVKSVLVVLHEDD